MKAGASFHNGPFRGFLRMALFNLEDLQSDGGQLVAAAVAVAYLLTMPAQMRGAELWLLRYG